MWERSQCGNARFDRSWASAFNGNMPPQKCPLRGLSDV